MFCSITSNLTFEWQVFQARVRKLDPNESTCEQFREKGLLCNNNSLTATKSKKCNVGPIIFPVVIFYSKEGLSVLNCELGEHDNTQQTIV